MIPNYCHSLFEDELSPALLLPKKKLIQQFSGSQSVVPGLASAGNLSEIQILGPYFESIESEPLGVGPAVSFNKPPRYF